MIILLIIYFVGLVIAKNEIFKVYAERSETYIIPAFSNSTFAEFQGTLNFTLSFPEYVLQSKFCIVSFDRYQYCDPEIFSEIPFQEMIFVSSNVSEDVLHEQMQLTADFIKLLFEDNNKEIERMNIIFLTDIFDFSYFFISSNNGIKHEFYFAILSVEEECIQNVAVQTEFDNVTCFNVLKDKPNDDKINDIIFDKTIYYTFDPIPIMYKYFIVMKENELDNIAELPQYLQLNNDFPYNGPTLYVAAIQVDDTHYYESVTVVFDPTLTYVISWSLVKYISSNSTTLSTKLVENYLKQSFEEGENNLNETWNIVITDSFPFWISNLNISFNSFRNHVDIYFCADNNSEEYDAFFESFNAQINDILVNDENASLRANHIMVFENVKQMIKFRQYLPSGKKEMTSQLFNFKTIKNSSNESKPWIWIILSAVLIIIIVIGIIGTLIWRRRMQQKLNAKYAWALQAGYTPNEAESIIENGKELFVDENSIEIKYENIKGKGSSAIVYAGFMKSASPISALKPSLETKKYANCEVAIKMINKFGRDDYEQIFREVEAGIKLGWHRHICCLLGWTIKQSTPVLIYESVDGGDLYSYIKSDAELNEKQIAQILWQIADGMEYIASMGIVHKDLATRNILLTASFVAKITDFGLASLYDESSFTYQAPLQKRLPIRWMAPEAMTERIFSEASDVWSFGVLAWEIFSKGAIPYGTLDGNDILEYLLAGKRLHLNDEILLTEWKEIIESCWNLKFNERPSFKEIKFKLSLLLERLTEFYGYICVNNEN